LHLEKKEVMCKTPYINDDYKPEKDHITYSTELVNVYSPYWLILYYLGKHET